MQAKRENGIRLVVLAVLLVLTTATGTWLFLRHRRDDPEPANTAAKPEVGWMRVVPNVANWSIIGVLQFVPENEGKPEAIHIVNVELDRSLREHPGGAPGDLPAFRVRHWQGGCLAKLSVPATPFGLDLSESDVTDAGLKELAGFKSLQALNLHFTKVTDAGLKELAELKGLETLNLYATKGRAKKWITRNPALSAAGMAVLLALGTAGLFAWRAHDIEERRKIEEQRRDAEAIEEKKRAAIERGMVAAMAADLPGAELAVGEAELQGASVGETRMLRGFLAHHAGQSAEAVRHLELATQLLPDRIAPRALLAVALYEQGDSAFRRIIAEVEAMTPVTPEDKLFKGSAVAIVHPADGLRLMDEALAARPSTLGHLLRADARLKLAQMTGGIEAAENAVAAAELAKQLLPDNPGRLGKSSSAHLAAVAAYERAGQPAKAAEHLAAAGREAANLARFDRNPTAMLYRFDVAAVMDGLEGKLDWTAELHAARAGRRDLLMTFYEAYNWFSLGNDQQTDAVASELPSLGTACVRVLAALGRPGGRATALSALDGFDRSDSPWRHRFTVSPFLYALDQARFTTVLKQLRREDDPVSNPEDRDEEKRCLCLLEGTLSEQELLAAPARGPVDLCRRHYFIAWKRLKEGDREGSRKAFEEAYRFKLVDYQSWVNSRVILIRMKDPNWPQAILGKKE